jgi:hypothetical protein
MSRGRTRLLARTFFTRLFENDLFSSSVSASSAITWLLAALATPGVMVSGSQLFYYARVRTFTPDQQDRILLVSQVFHVDFAMAVSALVTMLIWTSLTPDGRDALVLGPLPVTSGEQGRARLLALTTFASLFALAVAVPTSVIFTFVTLGASGLGNVLAHLAGHIAGAFAGSAFIFFTLVDVQLLVAATLGPRAVRTLSWPLQAAALLAMVAALYVATAMADAIPAERAAGSAVVAWNPAAWFVGLYRWVAGDERPIFSLLAARAAWSTVLAVGGALAVYPLAYERCLRNAIVSAGRADGSWTGSAAVVARCAAPGAPLAARARARAIHRRVADEEPRAPVRHRQLSLRRAPLRLAAGGTPAHRRQRSGGPLRMVFGAARPAVLVERRPARPDDAADRAGRELALQAHRARGQAPPALDGSRARPGSGRRPAGRRVRRRLRDRSGLAARPEGLRADPGHRARSRRAVGADVARRALRLHLSAWASCAFACCGRSS